MVHARDVGPGGVVQCSPWSLVRSSLYLYAKKKPTTYVVEMSEYKPFPIICPNTLPYTQFS